MTTVEGGGARITSREIYDAVLDLTATVQDLKAELKAEVLLSRQVTDITREHVQDLEMRMRSVERRVWSLPSLAAIIGVAGVALEVIRWVQQ